MSNNISALNQILFESLERLSNSNLDKKTMEVERDRANAIKGLADSILRSADIQLRYMQSLSMSIPVNTPTPEIFRLENQDA